MQHHDLNMVVRLLHRPKFEIFSTESKIWSKLSGTYLNQKQPFTGVYRYLQKNTYS